jgi:two-component system chemotaxis response regulator CheB
MICDLLSARADFEVVGKAADGQRAIELCGALRPNVISLDMMLSGSSGLAATEHIMAHFPTPILIVSASTNRAELFHTYQALAAARASSVIAIGASTGGPSAIVDVLQGLPTGLAVPILIVIHIDEPFSSSFAEWLDAQTPHRVAQARDGDALSSWHGRVAMAPAGRHLSVRNGHLRLGNEPPRHSCRPSVDVLFESLASEIGASAAACLLTGIGRDGANGLLAIRRAGGFTIAHDEASCVVYGMPREAALLKAAERILPLNQIGPALGRVLTGEKRAP